MDRPSVDSYLSNVQQNDFNKFYRAKTPSTQRNPEIPLSSPFDKGGKEGDLRNLGGLCAFARVIVFPIP
jgi:hypothetical protein